VINKPRIIAFSTRSTLIPFIFIDRRENRFITLKVNHNLLAFCRVEFKFIVSGPIHNTISNRSCRELVYSWLNIYSETLVSYKTAYLQMLVFFAKIRNFRTKVWKEKRFCMCVSSRPTIITRLCNIHIGKAEKEYGPHGVWESADDGGNMEDKHSKPFLNCMVLSN
jgi:hypothetical protein